MTFNHVASMSKTHIIEFDRALLISFVNMSHSINEYQEVSRRDVLDSIVKLIAEAVDAKSPYTGGHCNRVPQIAQMLVAMKQVSLDNEVFLKSFQTRE